MSPSPSLPSQPHDRGPMTAAPHDTTGDPRTDEQLLAAHAGGDADAFGVLLVRHGDRLWGLALRTSGDFDDYWAFHLAKEHDRTHRSHYATGDVPNPLMPSPPRLRLVK